MGDSILGRLGRSRPRRRPRPRKTERVATTTDSAASKKSGRNRSRAKNAQIFEDEDDDDWRLAPPSRRPDQDTRQKHQNTTEDDLENGREQWRIHEMIPDPRDDAKLNRHHDHGDEGSQQKVRY
jgi:hypothetical protein